MTRRSLATLSLFTILAPTLLGCLHATHLDGTRLAVERQLPGARFEPETSLKIGRLLLGVARRFDDEEVHVLRDIDRVELAVYRTVRVPSAGRVSFARDGWQEALTVADGDDRTWILFRGDGIRELQVVSLDAEELVVVQLHGNLQATLNRLLQEGILDVPGVVRADVDAESGRTDVRIDAE